MFSLLHSPPLEENPLSLLVPPSAEDGTVLSENWPNTHQCVGTLSAPAPGLFTGSASHENIAGDPHSPAHVPSWLSTSPGRSPRPKHSHDLFLHLPDFHVPPDAHPSATEPFVGIPVTWRRALPTTAELPPATWDGQGALHLLLGAISTWESALTSWHSLSLKKGYWNLYDLLLGICKQSDQSERQHKPGRDEKPWWKSSLPPWRLRLWLHVHGLLTSTRCCPF